MTMPTEPIRDIMRRTIANLKFIERHAEPNGPYEVTQLVNSFLGALAHPWEVMQDDLMQLSLVEAAARGWPPITKELITDREPRSLGELIGLMRNSFAHRNIKFLAGRKSEIRALRIWNKHPRTGIRTWGAVVTVDAA